MPDLFRTPPILLLKKRRSLATILLCAVVVLAACGSESGSDGDDDGGHVFVNQPQPTSTSVEPTIEPTEVVRVPPTAVPTVAPDELLEVRGAPRFIYLTINGGLSAYDANERSFTRVKLPDGFYPLGHSSSPTGDRVGVLGIYEDRYSVMFAGADGEPLSDPITLKVNVRPDEPGTPQASPVATPVRGSDASLQISWVPQGNGVLVSGPGVLQRVSMGGTIMSVPRAGAVGTVINAIWSPMDSQVVLQTQLMSGEQSVFVMNSGSDEILELEMLYDSAGPGITNLQWLPTGVGLVLVAGNADNGAVMNGQLYMYRFGEPVPVLIATSGQGGPAATISHAVVSPDGRSVAYAIMVRDLDEWHLHSVWVKPLRGGPAISIPVEGASPITSMTWGSEGLIWQQQDGSLHVVDGSLQPRPLGSEPVATPAASPVASPVVEPTPRG